MEKPYISVIIPVYNEETYLARCLASVTGQTFPDIEIIVVNDASTDGSGQIIESFTKADNRIVTVENHTNRGQGESRNTGIGISRGKYIFFVDCDDYLPDYSLKKLRDIAEEYNDDIIFGKTGSDTDIDSMYVSGELRSITIKDHPGLLYNHSVWNKLIRKKFIEENELLFDSRGHAEDILFALKCNLLASSISITRQITYFYQWERQVENLSKQKIIDARHNVLTALGVVKELDDHGLTSEMYRKTARICYATMVRACRVFDDDEIRDHLAWWQTVLAEIPADIIQGLSVHHRNFCLMVTKKQYAQALELWKNSQKPGSVLSKIFYRLLSDVKNKLHINQ